jgi:hypothetical protein
VPVCQQHSARYQPTSIPQNDSNSAKCGINGKIKQILLHGGAMHGSLHKWLLLPLLFALLAIPVPGNAQGQIILDTVTVQILPEYDNPDILVFLNIQLQSTVPLPTKLTFRLPGSVEKPYVVAVGPTSQTVTDQNIEYTYQKSGDWLEVTVTANDPAIRIEYYDPELTKEGENRSFSYLWLGDYAVNALSVSIRVPIDTTDITTDPQMKETIAAGEDQTYLEWSTSNLKSGQQIPIKVTYSKTSDRLSFSGPIQAGQVDENTQGRISLNNYLPYILGGLGILLIVGGGIYFWQTSQGKPSPRKRHRSSDEDHDSEDVYCHQCGKRAQPGDRFCRTCGTRLRRET